MKNINKTNLFFNKKVYPKLFNFALSPISWIYKGESSDVLSGMIEGIVKGVVGLLCSPILIPATIVTLGIALCLAVFSAVFHVLSLGVVGLKDYCSSETTAQTMTLA